MSQQLRECTRLRIRGAMPAPRARRLALVGFVLTVCLASFPQAACGQSFAKRFRHALRLYLDEDRQAREEGANRLRRLGDRALESLREWVEESERHLVRARELLADLDPEAQGDVVLVDPGDDPQVRKFLAQKLEDGWRDFQRGDYASAGAVARGLIALDGRSHLVYDYRRLLRACERRSIVEEVLEPVVSFQKLVYTNDQPPTVLFRLVNRRDKPLVVQTRRGLVGVLSVRVEHSLISGAAHEKLRELPIRTFRGAESIVVPARGVKEFLIRVPLDERFLVDRGVVSRVRVQGRFRPSQWGIDGKNVNHSLLSRSAECWLVPAGDQKLARAPLRKLEMALIFRDIHGFFVAAQLAAWQAEADSLLNERLVRSLVDSLSRLDDYGFEIANRFLMDATGASGEDEERDREYWTSWLANRGRAEEQEASPSGDAEPGGGVKLGIR